MISCLIKLRWVFLHSHSLFRRLERFFERPRGLAFLRFLAWTGSKRVRRVAVCQRNRLDQYLPLWMDGRRGGVSAGGGPMLLVHPMLEIAEQLHS